MCVLVESVLGCMCVSGASGCWIQVCVGNMCASDTCVHWIQVCVGDINFRVHVSLIHHWLSINSWFGTKNDAIKPLLA